MFEQIEMIQTFISELTSVSSDAIHPQLDHNITLPVVILSNLSQLFPCLCANDILLDYKNYNGKYDF